MNSLANDDKCIVKQRSMLCTAVSAAIMIKRERTMTITYANIRCISHTAVTSVLSQRTSRREHNAAAARTRYQVKLISKREGQQMGFRVQSLESSSSEFS